MFEADNSNGPSQDSADHFRLPALVLVFGRNTDACQEVTDLPIRKPIARHLSYRLNNTLFAKMGHQQTVGSAVSVGHLRRPFSGFSSLAEGDAKFNQGIPNRCARGKYLGGNLGYRSAFLEVFFFEESSRLGSMYIINHLK
jgi:hypothetical protein